MRLIDADLINRDTFSDCENATECVYAIGNIPTADVQPIVYCRDCKFYNKHDENLGDCIKFINFIRCVNKNWYCNFGAKMGGENNDT